MHVMYLIERIYMLSMGCILLLGFLSVLLSYRFTPRKRLVVSQVQIAVFMLIATILQLLRGIDTSGAFNIFSCPAQHFITSQVSGWACQAVSALMVSSMAALAALMQKPPNRVMKPAMFTASTINHIIFTVTPIVEFAIWDKEPSDLTLHSLVLVRDTSLSLYFLLTMILTWYVMMGLRRSVKGFILKLRNQDMYGNVIGNHQQISPKSVWTFMQQIQLTTANPTTSSLSGDTSRRLPQVGRPQVVSTKPFPKVHTPEEVARLKEAKRLKEAAQQQQQQLKLQIEQAQSAIDILSPTAPLQHDASLHSPSPYPTLKVPDIDSQPGIVNLDFPSAASSRAITPLPDDPASSSVDMLLDTRIHIKDEGTHGKIASERRISNVSLGTYPPANHRGSFITGATTTNTTASNFRIQELETSVFRMTILTVFITAILISSYASLLPHFIIFNMEDYCMLNPDYYPFYRSVLPIAHNTALMLALWQTWAPPSVWIEGAKQGGRKFWYTLRHGVGESANTDFDINKTRRSSVVSSVTSTVTTNSIQPFYPSSPPFPVAVRPLPPSVGSPPPPTRASNGGLSYLEIRSPSVKSPSAQKEPNTVKTKSAWDNAFSEQTLF